MDLTEIIESQKQLAKADFKFFQDSVVDAKNHSDYDFYLGELKSAVETGNEENINELRDLIGKKIEEHKNLFVDVESSRLNLVEHNNNLKAIKYKSKMLRFLAILIIITGLILMFYGFHNWQFKYQKFIDAEMKWKGEIFVELLREKELKPKDEQQRKNQESESESDS
ncbi:hypothetical protein [Flagellimonas crocea]|uniref:hypothetical protein n=1 Tax=Flagellimonas crocea TaxID=3067311 RepID=UPI00296FE4BD|nr:hypothetical protein [Muricauda sp. DH64]